MSRVPTEHSPASRHDRSRPYDVENVREAIGEDPGRFLDRPLFDGDQHTSSPGTFVRARIRGITRLDVVRAWIAVERQLDRGPRQRVIEMLEDREATIEAREESEPGRREIHHDREANWYALVDGERIPWEEYRETRISNVQTLVNHRRARADGGDAEQ